MKPDYKAFVLHVREWNKEGIPYGISDLIRLARRYGTPVPNSVNNPLPGG